MHIIQNLFIDLASNAEICLNTMRHVVLLLSQNCRLLKRICASPLFCFGVHNWSRDWSTAITCLHFPVAAKWLIMSSNLLISDLTLRPSGSLMFLCNCNCTLDAATWSTWISVNNGFLWQMLACSQRHRSSIIQAPHPAGYLTRQKKNRPLKWLPQLWVTMTCSRPGGPSLLWLETA